MKRSNAKAVRMPGPVFGSTRSGFNDRSSGFNSATLLRSPRSTDLIALAVGAFGISKAGAAYLPINPQTPGSRANFELADSGLRTIVSTGTSNGFDPRGRTGRDSSLAAERGL
ncbi:MAG: hypothetical protein ACRD8A_19945 [Candidatus Acidiferrales bacterium]